MLAVFLRSLGLHLGWFVRSFWPGAHDGAPLGLRRAGFLLIIYPLFLAVQLIHWLGFLLDELLFPGYRTTEVEAPVFVTGIPRSGTTFVHRTLAADPRFTSFSTWEALLAPSVTERKLIRAAAALDRALGRPLRRLLDSMIRRAGGGFDDIHEIRPDAPEEDYLALLPAGACFILLLAFPFAPALRQLGNLDRAPPPRRAQLIAFYRRCLQKHLYCAPPGTRLLSKNAAFASWTPALADAFPEARFLLCVREPLSALSSQLSSIDGARRAFGCEPLTETFTERFARNYQSLAEFLKSARPGTVAVLDQSELKAAPGPLLAEALRQLQLDPAPELRETLDRLRPAPPSGHRHQPADFALDRRQIDVCIGPAYRQILESPHHVRRSAD